MVLKFTHLETNRNKYPAIYSPMVSYASYASYAIYASYVSYVSYVNCSVGFAGI